jgi:8-oxo-dGTP pyrophosphatase MutT (NUDIX family)
LKRGDACKTALILIFMQDRFSPSKTFLNQNHQTQSSSDSLINTGQIITEPSLDLIIDDSISEGAVSEEEELKADQDKNASTTKKFNLRHIFRAGAVVWTKYNGQDYYLVFKSHTRPSRGTQLPGGRVERYENSAHAVLREVKEETGIDTKIVCPLGFAFFQSPVDKYSSLAIYYILRPTQKQDVLHRWKFVDKDKTHQELECWFVNANEPADFLASGQGEVVNMFKQWLEEHKRPEKEYAPNNTVSKTPKKVYNSNSKLNANQSISSLMSTNEESKNKDLTNPSNNQKASKKRGFKFPPKRLKGRR